MRRGGAAVGGLLVASIAGPFGRGTPRATAATPRATAATTKTAGCSSNPCHDNEGFCQCKKCWNLKTEQCCDDGHICSSNETCCGQTACCDSDERCCGGRCISRRRECCNGEPCEKGKKCCGETCIKNYDDCCGGSICKENEKCCDVSFAGGRFSRGVCYSPGRGESCCYSGICPKGKKCCSNGSRSICIAKDEDCCEAGAKPYKKASQRCCEDGKICKRTETCCSGGCCNKSQECCEGQRCVKKGTCKPKPSKKCPPGSQACFNECTCPAGWKCCPSGNCTGTLGNGVCCSGGNSLEIRGLSDTYTPCCIGGVFGVICGGKCCPNDRPCCGRKFCCAKGTIGCRYDGTCS